MSAPADRLAREHPETDRYLGVYVVPFPLYLVGSLFLSAVVLVLLIACANVAKLFFSRTFVRHESLATGRVGRQPSTGSAARFAEAVVVASAEGVAGLGLAALRGNLPNAVSARHLAIESVAANDGAASLFSETQRFEMDLAGCWRRGCYSFAEAVFDPVPAKYFLLRGGIIFAPSSLHMYRTFSPWA